MIRFRELTKTELVTWIPGYHPLYSDAPDQWIVYIDDRYAHGLLSRWRTFTNSAIALAAERDHTGRLTNELIKGVLERLGHQS